MPRNLLATGSAQPATGPAQPSVGGTNLLTQSPAALGQQTPLQDEDEPGLIESFAQGAAQGVTLGFADELYGLAAGAIPGGMNRGEATSAARARLAKSDPAAALAGELAGSMLIPGGAAKTGASLGARALRGAVAGGAAGGVGAIGRAEGTLEERLPEAGPGAALGVGFGGAAAAAAPAIAQGARRLLPSRQEQTAVQQMVQTATRDDEVGSHARRAISHIQQAADQRKFAVNQAYDEIGKLSGAVEDKASFELLSNKLNRVLDEGGVEFTEGGDRVTNLVDRVVSQLEGGATPEKMEKTRQLIAKVSRGVSPMNPQEGMHLGQVQRAYEDWMFDTLTNKLYRGDETAVRQIKEARGLSREYHRLFGKYSGGAGTAERTAGGMISRILQDDVEAEEAVNLLFGANAIGLKGSRQAIARIRDASPEAFEQLQSAHFVKLITAPGGGDFLPADRIVKRIQKLNETPLAKTLYGDALGQINRFGEKLKSGPNVGETVANFIKARPGIFGFLMGTTGGAMASGGDPMTTTFAGILGAALSRGRGAPTPAHQIRRAARPDIGVTRRAGQVGGTAGAIIGPSLGGG